jgi:hypothetical protein
MADPRRPELTSAFDDMLALSKKRFDDLYVRGQARTGTSFAAARSPAAPRPVRLGPDSAVVRRLRERFGSDWRYEIAEQQRDGDEAIVLCKLTFGKDGAVRTQFGRARMSSVPLSGASDGVRFKLDAAGTEPDQGDAFLRATEAALSNCFDLI